MLVIRDAQLRAFDEDARERFEARMRVHLPAALPDEVRALSGGEDPEPVLVELVRESERLASEWALRDDAARVALAELMVVMGPDLQARPELEWAARLLRSGSGSGDARVRMVHRVVFGARGGGEE